MSELQPGPDHWQASDGLWYPPESAPGGPAPQPGQGAYPARLTVSDDNKIARWRALLQGFMAIPHFIVFYLLNIAGL
ncbi:MAG: hypothetical protein ACC660_05150, partial [Acidimicrobiales bacterium]